MEYKIVQIIPSTKNMYAEYIVEGTKSVCPIVCMALIEYSDGSRDVVFMESDGSGSIDVLGSKARVFMSDKPVDLWG